MLGLSWGSAFPGDEGQGLEPKYLVQPGFQLFFVGVSPVLLTVYLHRPGRLSSQIVEAFLLMFSSFLADTQSRISGENGVWSFTGRGDFTVGSSSF